jgi:radial spoke head protein 4/6
MKGLASTSGAAQLRFFGKIHGLNKDYYIVEAVMEGEGEADEDGGDNVGANAEPKGTGVNKYTYFVAQNSLDKWTKLPDLNPSLVEGARQIRCILTGDLDRQIYSNPSFPGQEKHYLRAQIARISHSTTVLPASVWRLVEDDDRNIEENVHAETGEIPQPSTKEMTDLSMWVHASPSILKNSRTMHLEPEEPGEDDPNQDFDPEEAKKQIELADPFEPRLKPLTKDERVYIGGIVKAQSLTMPWVVRHVGDTSEYTDVTDPKKKVSYGAVVLRSLIWPGAVSIYHKGEITQIYVGSGLKLEDCSQSCS